MIQSCFTMPRDHSTAPYVMITYRNLTMKWPLCRCFEAQPVNAGWSEDGSNADGRQDRSVKKDRILRIFDIFIHQNMEAAIHVSAEGVVNQRKTFDDAPDALGSTPCVHLSQYEISFREQAG